MGSIAESSTPGENTGGSTLVKLRRLVRCAILDIGEDRPSSVIEDLYEMQRAIDSSKEYVSTKDDIDMVKKFDTVKGQPMEGFPAYIEIWAINKLKEIWGIK